MKQIRVSITAMAPMLRDILSNTLNSQPDMELVAEPGEGEALIAALKRLQVDAVVVGAHEPDDTVFAKGLLEAYPNMRVVVVAKGGTSAAIYELHPQRVTIEDLSPDSLIAALRHGIDAAESRRP